MRAVVRPGGDAGLRIGSRQAEAGLAPENRREEDWGLRQGSKTPIFASSKVDYEVL
jgi:hypothetical protein